MPTAEHREHGGEVVAPDPPSRIVLCAGKTAARERREHEQADRSRTGPDPDLLAGGERGPGHR